MAREAQRDRISHDVSYAVKQIGRTTVQTDGAYMDVPVVSGPTVRAGASDGPSMDFIAFIGKVINTTRVVESRNARLKVIVETAK